MSILFVFCYKISEGAAPYDAAPASFIGWSEKGLTYLSSAEEMVRLFQGNTKCSSSKLISVTDSTQNIPAPPSTFEVIPGSVSKIVPASSVV